MVKDYFDINTFNVYSDDNYYYFFRALEELDLAKMEDGSILNADGSLAKLITDREFYGETKYTKDQNISLKEMYDHIKMHYDRHTNCISFTSNANCALTYGRQAYDDKYVMIRVPKTEMGKNDYQAGYYMLEQIEQKIDELISNHEVEDYDVQKYFMDFINNAKSEEDLENIKKMLPKEYVNDNSMYVGGVKFNTTSSITYQSLNEKQNFIKNKIIMKLDILNKNLIPGVSNKFLIQTVGNAFASLEIIHYKDVDGNNLIQLPKEIMDLLGILQQLPNNLNNVSELKNIILQKAINTHFTGNIDYSNMSLDEDNFTIENMFAITNGNVSYKMAKELYQKAFYLAKAKVRAKNSLAILKKLVDNDSRYEEIYNYLDSYSFGIEPELTTKLTGNFYNISESISLDLNAKEAGLIDYINELNYNQLNSIINNPNEALKELLTRFTTKEDLKSVTREEWMANAIIDNFDWNSLGVTEVLSDYQKQDITNKLRERDFQKVYTYLKSKNIKEKDISYILFYLLIKSGDKENISTDVLIENIDSFINNEDQLSLEEIEWFIGYNQIKDTSVNLRYYQKSALTNINNLFNDKQFAACILPTGAGKSYVALAEIYERIMANPNEKILYLAPNVEILNQFKGIMRDVLKPEEHLGDSLNKLIKRNFPNLTFATYQDLKDLKTSEIKAKYADDYDFIIFDELHRTGAPEWQQTVETLTDNQKKKVKILGLTATPQRDSDFKNMVDYWAYKYGYSEKAIASGEPMAANMDIIEAIEEEIILSPRVILSMYSTLNDGTISKLEETVNNIADIETKNHKKETLNLIKKHVENSNGIEKLVHDNLQNDNKYIVFLPVNKKDNGEYEDENGNLISKTTAEKVIKDYQLLMKQYMFSYDYLNNNQKILDIYNKISSTNLSEEEANYLNQEKEKILLLTKIDIANKPSALNTDTNIIADSIVKYMGWQELYNTEKARKLTDFTKDKVEVYSMLGSYSKKKNEDMLASFNNPTDNKMKLMFVMNKLNEGVHTKDIGGIVWLRKLDDKSLTLYLQQLGRCIKSITPGTGYEEKDRPLVLDLVNNTLNINFRKESKIAIDLRKLKNACNWLHEHNDIFPKKNIENERKYYNIFEYIYSDYTDYVDNSDLLNSQDITNRIMIEEIISLGSSIDLWSMEFNKVKRERNRKNNNDDILDAFGITGIERDFIDIVQESNSINDFDYYYNFLVQLKKQGLPTNLASIDKIRINDDGTSSIVKINNQYIGGKPVQINKEEYQDNSLILLGAWLYRNQGKFNDTQKQMLRDIGYVLQEDRNTFEEDFEYYYDLLVQLKKQGLPTNLVSIDKIRINDDGTSSIVKQIIQKIGKKQFQTNKEEYQDKKLICIGSWLYRNQGKFNDTQKQMLRDIGYVLQEDRNTFEEDFEYYYDLLVQLKKQGLPPKLVPADKIKINDDGTLSIVKKHIDGKNVQVNKTEYQDKKLICIGSWLHEHQKDFTEPQKQRLRDIGYVLQEDRNTFEDNFDYYYNFLVQLKEQGLPTNLSNRDKVRINDDGTISIVKKITQKIGKKQFQTNKEEYQDKSLICVGYWLYRNQEIFTEPQKQMLRDVGYELREDKNTFEDDFEYHYNLLLQLKKQGLPTNLASTDKINDNGTLSIVKIKTQNIGGKLVQINKEEYQDKSLISLGDWLYKNQKKFTEPQKQMLRDIGYALQEDKVKKYDAAKEVFDEESTFDKVRKEIEERKNARKIS